MKLLPTQFWLAVLLYAAPANHAYATSRKQASPPPHPGTPNLFTTKLSPRPVAITVSGAAGDVVTLESDTLRLESASARGVLSSAASARLIKLAGGGTVMLDDKTQAGTYTQEDGSEIVVPPEFGYPRWVEFQISRARVLYFNVGSHAKVGALISGDSAADGPAEYVAALRRGRPSSGFREQSGNAAFECPETGPTRAAISLSPNRISPVYVTWFAYDSDPSEPLVQTSGLRKMGNRAEWRAEWAVPRSEYPRVLSKSSRVSLADIRLVGRVVIRPLTNEIEAQ